MMKGKRVKSLVVVIAMVLSFISVSSVNTKAAANPYSGGYGNCTWTAWQLCYNATGCALPAWGNAGNWLNNAKRAGWSTGSTPRANSIAVWYGGGYGHVGWVTSVSGNRIYVKEGNYNGKYHEGWLPASGYRNSYQYIAGYIYVGFNPQGYIDSCSGGTGCINVRGWAFDKDNASQSIQVHVYIGGYAGNKNAECHAITANATRDDVNRAFGISGRHGYNNAISTNKSGRQLVAFYAINIGTGSNVFLGERTVNIAHNPQGYIDGCSGGTGCINVRGWAFDRDNSSKSTEVHVYIGGYAGNKNAEGYAITANKTRDDVNRVFGISGKHGYSNTIVTNKRGRQLVTFYAINIGSGSNVYLGSRTVNISNTKYMKTSKSSVTVNRGKTTNFKIYFKRNTNFGSWVANSTVAKTSWGKWNSKTKSIPLYVKGLKKGNTFIVLRNSYNSDVLMVKVYVK